MIYPVFDHVPDFSTDPVYSITNETDAVRIAPGVSTVFFPTTQNDRIFKFQFTWLDAAAIREAFAFFSARGGRAHPFYLPSWRSDLPIVSAAPFALTVRFDDYAAAHLTDTKPDHYGRQIYVWSADYGLFVAQVVGAVDGENVGESILALGSTCPFPIDPHRCIAGFLHLVRFSEDRIAARFSLPTVATAPITFRGIRQWTGGA